MVEFPVDSCEVRFEVAGIASAPSSIEERAEALLDQLRQVVPFRLPGFACLIRSVERRCLW